MALSCCRWVLLTWALSCFVATATMRRKRSTGGRRRYESLDLRAEAHDYRAALSDSVKALQKVKAALIVKAADVAVSEAISRLHLQVSSSSVKRLFVRIPAAFWRRNRRHTTDDLFDALPTPETDRLDECGSRVEGELLAARQLMLAILETSEKTLCFDSLSSQDLQRLALSFRALATQLDKHGLSGLVLPPALSNIALSGDSSEHANSLTFLGSGVQLATVGVFLACVAVYTGLVLL